MRHNYSLPAIIRLALNLLSLSLVMPLSASVTGSQGAIATAHPIASQVGLEILKRGGNAFDAAIAVQFTLAVVYPHAGNIGGGGFLLYHTSEGEIGALDFRERAPLGAHRNLYLDADGNVIEGLSRNGALAVGVPGTVAGMEQLHQRFGTLPWMELLQPAIDIADNGFALTEFGAQVLNEAQHDFNRINTGKPQPFVQTEPFTPGHILRQPALARTLQRIQQKGAGAFYAGETAEALVQTVRSHGGLITQEDLDQYQAIWRNSVSASCYGHTVHSMSPPSSGGIALIQLLIGSEGVDLSSTKPNSADEAHLMAELMRRVYADRATYLGDTDYVDVPVQRLIDPVYIAARNADIDPLQATPSQSIKEGRVDRIESYETTHFSIVDNAGNAAAITTTLNSAFGSKLFVQDAGFFLNNEMDDFSAKPGVPNQFGLVGSEANSIAPGKRMLSSMSPTLVTRNGKLRYVLGTPGGSTIITNVYQTLINLLVHHMSLQTAVDDRKIHAQWLPDEISYESGALDADALRQLQERGHALREVPRIGRLQAISLHPDGSLEAAADVTRVGDSTALAF